MSKYNENFILKGGIFLYAIFGGEFSRATRDIDLLAKSLENEVEIMRKVFEEIVVVESDDAIKYKKESLSIDTITEFKEYQGINIKVMAMLDKTAIPVSIDIGFGDSSMRNLYENESVKIKWKGRIVSIQPRTRVWRYVTDNRTHYHIGYNIFLEETTDESVENFAVAISEKQQLKGAFRIGDIISGTAWTKKYPEREYADYYRSGAIKILERSREIEESSCPWTGPLPEMELYEYRGARMLSQNLWKGKCFTCFFAAMSNVEIQWDFDRDIKKYRFESFCYGPKSCKYYKPGRARTVPYKGRDSALDTGWLDDLCTENREWDD